MQEFLVVSSILSWLVIIVNLLLTLALIYRFNNQTQSNITSRGGQVSSSQLLAVGEVAPSFAGLSTEGKNIILNDFAGQTTVFTFVSATCPPCQDLVGLLKQLQPQINKLKLNFVMVGLDTASNMIEFSERAGVDFPIILISEGQNDFLEAYKIQATPTVYVLDHENRVKWAGLPDLSALESLMVKWAA